MPQLDCLPQKYRSLFSANRSKGNDSPMSAVGRKPSGITGLVLGMLFATQTFATPASSDSVGYIAGELDVSGGSAGYSIPIAVPPGVAGMEPLLSLNYSSQSGNGLLGLGWNLSGISLVHRCGSTLVQDGQNRQVKLDGQDNYCIDGKRLIPVNGANGADGTEYRTEIDGFSKVISYGSAGNGPAWFKVWTKSGQIMEFGNTADSRVEAQGKSTVLNYAVNKISDTSLAGNSIQFHYNEITANTEFVPSHISYGPNQQNKVQFTYSEVTDLAATKLEGSNIKTTQRISKIETFANNEAVQNWTFTFEERSKKPAKLTALKLCAADGSCLPETTIAWSAFKPITNSKADSYTVDFNGDGIADTYRLASTGSQTARLYVTLQDEAGNGVEAVAISNLPKLKTLVPSYEDEGITFYDTVYRMPTVAGVGDFSGDGFTDIELSVSGTFKRYRSDGNGSFSFLADRNLPAGDYVAHDNYDFNGDGIEDYLSKPKPNHLLKVALGNSNGSNTLEATYDINSAWYLHGFTEPQCTTSGGPEDFVTSCPIASFNALDINNDGITDIEQDGRIYLGSQAGFSYFTSVSAYENHADTQLDMVTSITNNTTTTLEYASILDSSVYPNQNESVTYPEKELRGTYLIKSVTSDNGIGGTRLTTYQYGGAKVNEIGRGYQGFAWVEETDQSTGTKVRTEFNQQFPYIGMVSKTETFLADGTLINKAESQYTHTTSHNGKIYFPYVTTSSEQSFERDGSLVSTITTENDQFDAYGNLGWVKVTTTGGSEQYSKTTVNTYANDESKWHLGRLLTASVTHQHADGSSLTRNSAFEYDPTTGFLTKEIVEPGTVMEVATTTTYDNHGNKIAVSTTAASESTPRSASTAFDANGQFPVSSSNALGHSDSKTTDARYGVLLSQTGPNGLTTTWEYDSFGNQTKENRADGTSSTVSRHWIDSGQCAHAPEFASYCVISQSDGSAPAETYYDSLNRKLRTVTIGFNGQPVYKDTVYNSLGQVEKVSRAYYANALQTYWATSTFDDMGRLIKAEEPGVNGTISATSTTYNGLTTIATNAKGQSKTTVTNALGKVISVQEPEGASMSYQYDALGNLIKTTDSAGNIVTIDYDLLGRKIGMNDPDMGIWSYEYNGYGELISQTDAKGQTSQMSYDVLGRMVQRVEPEGTTTWTYDSASHGIGKLAQVVGADGYKKTYVYDHLGRLQDAVTEADNKVLSISTEYDQYSRLKKLVRPQGFVSENLYTAEGYLQAVRGLRGQVDDYTVDHLESLLETSIRDAQALQNEAFELLTLADRYFAVADEYASKVGDSAPATIPDIQMNLKAGDRLDVLVDGNGQQYVQVKDYSDEAKTKKIVIIPGEIDTPVLARIYQKVLLKVDGNVLSEFADSRSATFARSLSTTEKTLYIRDANSDGALELLVLSGLDEELKTNLMRTADTLDSEALILAAEAGHLVAASELLIQVAESVYREALLAGYWAGGTDQYQADYQSLIQDDQYVYFWQAKERDAEGRLARELHGNGLSTVYNYDPSNGLLLRQQTGFANFDKLRDLEYQYDALNNVTQRADLVTKVEESFTYDALDRLISSNVISTDAANSFNETKTYAYDALGNITHKSDLGNYIYDSARPHAVISAGGNTYDYDANGNMISGAGRALTWSSFNKPITMAKDGKTVNFTYAPDRSRYLKQGSDGTKTLYLDKLYELITNGQAVTHKQFIYAGSSLVAVHVSGLDHNGSDIPVQTRYMHKDNLGSVDAITDGVGNVVERMSFDPFGSRRQSNWREANVGINLIPVFTNRGFTGHEHIDEMDLIHMNGRVYDPMLGRFLSADPHIQSPHSTQSYNRYSYVNNNPLKYTDPSGYFLGGLFKAIGKVFKNFVKRVFAYPKAFFNAVTKPILQAVADIPILNAAVQAVGCFYAGPACAQFLAMYNGATTYAVTGDLKASLKSAAISYASAKASGHVGEKFAEGSIRNIVGNGVVQGTVSKIQGGSFKDGFISAAVSAAFKPKIFDTFGRKTDGISVAKRVTAAAVIGGTSSVLGGGKFANGAISGAFSQMLNGEPTNAKTQKSTGDTYELTAGADAVFALDGKGAGISLTFGVGDEGVSLTLTLTEIKPPANGSLFDSWYAGFGGVFGGNISEGEVNTVFDGSITETEHTTYAAGLVLSGGTTVTHSESSLGAGAAKFGAGLGWLHAEGRQLNIQGRINPFELFDF